MSSITGYLSSKRVLILLLALGLLTHFVALSSPRQVIFDEVHFGKFVTAYCCTGERVFDIHPPHGKLLIAGAAKIAGFDGGVPFETIGERYPANTPVWALRFLPAVMGVLLPILIFTLARQLGARLELATLAALLVLFDTALTLQTRVIALDGFLLVGTFGGLSAALKAIRDMSDAVYARAYRWFALAGALAGLAVGSKFTGLLAPGLIGVLVIQKYWNNRGQHSKEWLRATAWFAVSGLVIYLLGWVLHFALLSQPGSGDAFHVPDFSGFPVTRFIAETLELHVIMFDANSNLSATHPYASYWWTWPVMARPVFYWQDVSRLMYLFGNPVVWWSALATVLMALASTVVSYGAYRSKRTTLFVIVVIGYLMSYVPLMQVTRPLFLYHYFTPLIFSILVSSLWLEDVLPRTMTKKQYIGLGGVAAVACLAFIFFSPLVYGYAPPFGLDHLFWFSSWR